MSSKVRLAINFTVIFLAFAVIVVSVGAILKKTTTFLNPTGILNKATNLNMNIVGKINDTVFFEVKFVNNQPDQDINNIKINEAETTFTMDNQVLSYTLTFDNKAEGTIYIFISGIYIDEFDRFETRGEVSNVNTNPVIIDGDTGLGYIMLEVPGVESEESVVDVTLTYTLVKFNREINNVQQNLNIEISNQPIDF